jgi:hypothetical protein
VIDREKRGGVGLDGTSSFCNIILMM